YALVDGELLTFRLPYPSGLFPKNVDGRIDDPKAGWKGRALWTTSGTRTLFHNEGGKEMRHKAVKIQLRPDPLAR
ncbi:MAG: carboxypeptidase regulatory-like domain-containing protein, partial [Betaproteobacteria bacterium]